MSENAVKLEIDEAVAVITLNRPESLNAFNDDVFVGLRNAVQQLTDNDGVRAVVLTGAGDRAFSAGLDLKALAAGEVFKFATAGDGVIGIITRVKEVFTAIEELPIPVIAAIKGHCLGAGVQLVAACDIRLAAENAKFAVLETKLGIVPDLGGTQRLPRIVGPGMARELIYTSRSIDAAEALRIGLVEHVYPVDRLNDEALALAREIAERSPQAIQGAKRATRAAMSLPLELGLRFETEVAASVVRLDAFVEQGAQFARRTKTP